MGGAPLENSENSGSSDGGASAVESSAARELDVASGGGVVGTSAAKPPAESTKKGKQSNKPQECAIMQLKELRLGRCITFKQHDCQYLLNLLEKAFKEKAVTADESHTLLVMSEP